jgi:hypothetical protein
MRAGLNSRLDRLERVEAQAAAIRSLQIRLGPIKKLPCDYTGERHIAIVKRLPPTSSIGEQVEFEERPGPAPEQPEGHIINVCFVGTGGNDASDSPAFVQA